VETLGDRGDLRGLAVKLENFSKRLYEETKAKKTEQNGGRGKNEGAEGRFLSNY